MTSRTLSASFRDGAPCELGRARRVKIAGVSRDCCYTSTARTSEGGRREGRKNARNRRCCQPVARATCFERSVRPPHQPMPHCYIAVRCFKPAATRSEPRHLPNVHRSGRARVKPRVPSSREPRHPLRPSPPVVRHVVRRPAANFIHEDTRFSFRSADSRPPVRSRMRKRAHVPLLSIRCTYGYIIHILYIHIVDISF